MYCGNKSQLQPSLKIVTEYFIDQEKYFYLIILHANVALFIGSLTMLATGTMLLTYMQHVCGMLKIASYRIKHAVNTYVPQNITIKNKTLMIEDIICAIDIHRQAMKMTKHFMTTFEIMMSCITGCLVVCFSFNLFQVSLQFHVIIYEDCIEIVIYY
ncbi:PREDICTED: uncharacterized protein LOC105619729 [Atta cephalotes]|uniref:Odorant receptor n=1 Tax=Atta cephalotes TaxID=12957 RepID=A0A158NGI0_ATTCE|nr:PREDICTED: uncharacterized protein LOC105619729 [Atta cephalotes]